LNDMDRVIGTAGHIDHGKTALVKALTGVDADRLPDEKRRGITIDLGFAEMTAGDVHFGFVDVPGHERFVRNMLAGASGIDLVLLVVAADKGVMPQTREHFEICRLLGLEQGVVALTKTDLADPEMLELARLDVAELVAGSFLENAPVIPVSSKTGAGVDELREVLQRTAHKGRSRTDRFVTFLPVDRSFTIKGFGTVVTGTLGSGEIAEGDELVLMPDTSRVRVRGVQSHGESANKVGAGRRTAVNLAGVDHDEVTRGMVLTTRDVLRPTSLLDCSVEMLASAPRPLRSRQRVRVHLGTSEVLARVQVLNEVGEIMAGALDFAQLRLESPVTALPVQRLIIRSYSPQATIGGGTILDIAPQKHKRREIPVTRDLLKDIATDADDDAEWLRVHIESSGMHGTTFPKLRSRTGLTDARMGAALETLIGKSSIKEGGGSYVSSEIFSAIGESFVAAISDFHKREPLAPGITREALLDQLHGVPATLSTAVLVQLGADGKIVQEADAFCLASHSTKLTDDESHVVEKLTTIYKNAGLEVPRVDEVLAAATADVKMPTEHARKLLQHLVAKREIVKATEEFYFSRAAIDQTIRSMNEYARAAPDRIIDVPRFKELTGISRKYAIPLLEYFDNVHVTVRSGDKRVIL
jgi:selenocysteine-specific elongation factor